ncbi:hypothetical protein Plec18167_001717 [Paecilomyces lecythidis]|uniref:FAD-binding PCMH-type domain-containing protein n=1 Tax=Paecilomyces lecythidis TaxID=3004212 RepID=A0ABR3YAN9_9EURO
MEQLLIERGFSGRILDATSPGYAAALERDNLASERKARLIVFPRSERDLSIAIQAAKQSVSQILPNPKGLPSKKVLRSGEKIAVKCGGHNHSTANSVENGVVIDMGSVKMIHIDRENMQVNVGGGCLWGEVYATLDKEGLMCVGGGVSVVGVGGHITGGSLSHPHVYKHAN